MFSGFATYFFGTNNNDSTNPSTLEDESTNNNLEIRDAEDEWVLVDTQVPDKKGRRRSESESKKENAIKKDEVDDGWRRVEMAEVQNVFKPVDMEYARSYNPAVIGGNLQAARAVVRLEQSMIFNGVSIRCIPAIPKQHFPDTYVRRRLVQILPSSDQQAVNSMFCSTNNSMDSSFCIIGKMAEDRERELENLIKVANRKKTFRRQLTCYNADDDERKAMVVKVAKERRQAAESKAKAVHIQQVQQNKAAQLCQREHEDRRLSKRQLDRHNKMRDRPSQGKQFRRQEYAKQPSGRTNSRNNCRC